MMIERRSFLKGLGAALAAVIVPLPQVQAYMAPAGFVPLDTSAWYHFVITFDASAIDKVYVNGTRVSIEKEEVQKKLQNVLDATKITKGPETFGEEDPETGQWRAKRTKIEYGENDFHLF